MLEGRRAASTATVAATRTSAAVLSSMTDGRKRCRRPRSLQGAPRRARRAAAGAPCTRPSRGAHLTCGGLRGASSFQGEMCPRRVDRALQEPDLDGTLDRLAARRGPELAVDRDRFGLDGVARDEQPARDLREREMRREVRKQPELRGVRLIAQAPADSEVAATRSRSSRASSTSEPMCGRSSSTRSVSVRIVRAAPASASARWARVSSSPTGRSAREGRGRAAAADGERAPAPRAHRPVSPHGARHAPSRRARSRSSRSRRGPPRRRSLAPRVRVALPRPRLPAWPRGARAVPVRGGPPRRRRRPAPCRRLP